jgi:hypothetical protein
MRNKIETFTKFKMFKELQLKEKWVIKSKQSGPTEEVNLHQYNSTTNASNTTSQDN